MMMVRKLSFGKGRRSTENQPLGLDRVRQAATAEDGDAEERAFWQRTLGEADFTDGDLERAQALLAAHDALNRSVAVAHDHAVKAGAALAPYLSDDRTAPLARALADAALFAAHRAS